MGGVGWGGVGVGVEPLILNCAISGGDIFDNNFLFL